MLRSTKRQSTGRLRRCLPTVLAWALLAGRISPASAEQAKESAKEAQAAGDAPDVKAGYQGMDRCLLCHRQPLQPQPGAPPEPFSRDFCLMNESTIFAAEDKHAQAYTLLQSELGRQMGRKMGIDVTKSKACLNCHYGGQPLRNDAERPRYEVEGVGCEACHGPSALWEGEHSRTAWRKLKPADKSAKGMIDIHDPVERARLCFSCHIGSVENDRVVTHDMYAAGHPPLPGIELETFMTLMPPHWRNIREKGDFEFRAEYLEANYPGGVERATEGLPRTRAVLIGGLVALRESLNLFARASWKGDQPEFAQFDCQACHHDLRLPAWRQNRSIAGRPGRPRVPAWPRAVAGVALEALAAGSESGSRERQWLDARIVQLHQVLDAQPFGEFDLMAQIISGQPGAEGLVAWLDAKTTALASAVIDTATATKALTALQEEFRRYDMTDFHTARQFAWAIRSIESEVKSLPYPTFAVRLKGETLAQERARVKGDVTLFYDDWRPRIGGFERAAGPLDNVLRLNLPAGQKYVIAEVLKPQLEAIVAFEESANRNSRSQAAGRSSR